MELVISLYTLFLKVIPNSNLGEGRDYSVPAWGKKAA